SRRRVYRLLCVKLRPHPAAPLFPSTTLFRSTEERLLKVGKAGTAEHVERIVRGWRRVDEIAEARDTARRHKSRALHIYKDEDGRSEEHTSELQSPDHLVCRLLLEKKKMRKRC